MAGLAGHTGEALIVGNPISGWGKVARHLDAVANAVRDAGLTVQVLRTAKSGDARQAAERFQGGLILVFGGDGTFNEVLSGADLERCALGIIPAGTGNVLAKELGMPRGPKVATRALIEGRTVRMDVGVCNGHRFASMIGAGLDAHVVDMIHRNRKGRLTQLHYVPVVARGALRPEKWDIQVEVDGRLVHNGANIVCVGNTHSYGGPVEFTSAATPADGLLDVTAIRVQGAASLAGVTLGALLHSLHRCPSAVSVRGRSVSLRSSREDVPWQRDGDFGGHLPAQISIEPARMQVIAPHGFRPARGLRGACP